MGWTELQPGFGRPRAYSGLVFLLLIYPCLSTAYGLYSLHERHFTAHGDLRDDVFSSTPDNEPAKFFKRGDKTRPKQGSSPPADPASSD